MAARQVLIPDNQNFDNQSFDSPNSSSLPSFSAGSRKRPLSETPHHDLFAKAHKASLETGLVPLEMGAGCKIVSQDFEKIKNAKNIGHSKNLCQYPGHRSTQGHHKKLHFFMDANERVAVRQLLTTRINVTHFESSLRSQFFDLRCHNYGEIILACFPSEDYRKRWIVLEEDGVGRRFISHRQLTEDIKSRVKMILSKSVSCNSVRNKLVKQVPCLMYLTVYDILMSVYGEDFYSKNKIFRQCGPIPDLSDRMVDRYLLWEKALISPISSMISQTDGQLTMEQKYVVIGLLHQKTNLGKIRADLSRMFPESFSPRSYIDVLDVTFGDYREVCILTEPCKEDSSVQALILDDKFSSKSVLNSLRAEEAKKSGKVKKGKKKPNQFWKKGQIVGKSRRKVKGGVM